MPLRVKLAIGAFAGLAAAWLLPRGGVPPVATPTPTPPGQLTASEEPLTAVHPGVSFRMIDGVRVFLVRTGDTVVGFVGVATTPEAGSIYWCPKNRWFEGSGGSGPYYAADGSIARYSSRRSLDRIQVLVAAGRVTIFPHQITPGAAATFPTDYAPPLAPPPEACAPNERVG
jgi:hypothetical protein